MCPETEPPKTITFRGKEYVCHGAFPRRYLLEEEAEEIRSRGSKVHKVMWENHYVMYVHEGK